MKIIVLDYDPYQDNDMDDILEIADIVIQKNTLVKNREGDYLPDLFTGVLRSLK